MSYRSESSHPGPEIIESGTWYARRISCLRGAFSAVKFPCLGLHWAPGSPDKFGFTDATSNTNAVPPVCDWARPCGGFIKPTMIGPAMTRIAAVTREYFLSETQFAGESIR